MTKCRKDVVAFLEHEAARRCSFCFWEHPETLDGMTICFHCQAHYHAVPLGMLLPYNHWYRHTNGEFRFLTYRCRNDRLAPHVCHLFRERCGL